MAFAEYRALRKVELMSNPSRLTFIRIRRLTLHYGNWKILHTECCVDTKTVGAQQVVGQCAATVKFRFKGIAVRNPFPCCGATLVEYATWPGRNRAIVDVGVIPKASTY